MHRRTVTYADVALVRSFRCPSSAAGHGYVGVNPMGIARPLQ